MKIRCGRYHGKDCETIYQEDRNYCQWVLDVDTGNPAVIEFRNFIKTRDEQWEERCREQKRIELEEREAKIEEKRRTAEAEAEAKERERIMKQIRRAEIENERSEERDNHNDNDNDAKKFTEEAKGSKTKADDFTIQETGGKAKAGNLTEAKGNKARADYFATEAKGSKAGTEEDRNRHEAAAYMIHKKGEEFPFGIGREITHNEIKMVINQRTETGIQTSETGQRVGEQWESQWRNTNRGKRFNYWGVGKHRIPVGLRERRSQLWCRTEDVRTMKERDVNTDKWRIETPLGISKQECNEDKLETRVTMLEEQTKWMYDRMTAAAAESSTWNRGIPWRYEDNGDEWQRWEGSWWIRVNQDDLNSRQRRKISRNLRKMIDREKNGMARLHQEQKKGIREEVEFKAGC